MDKKITTKEDIEKHTYNGLLEVLNQGIIYKYVDFHIGINDILMPDGLKIKFDNPETFNDPFDCHEGLINFNKTENEDVKEYLEIQNQVLDRKNRRFVTRQTNKKKNMIKFFKEKKDLYKVSSFLKIITILSCGHIMLISIKESALAIVFQSYQKISEFIMSHIEKIFCLLI